MSEISCAKRLSALIFKRPGFLFVLSPTRYNSTATAMNEKKKFLINATILFKYTSI